MTIEEKLAKRQVLLDEAKAIQQAADDEDRSLTDEEVGTIEANLAEAKTLAEEIKAERDRRKQQAELRASIESESAWEDQIEPLQTRAPRLSGQPNIVGGEAAPGFAHFGEFLHNVRVAPNNAHMQGQLEQKIQAISGLGTAVDSEGGFLIPPEFSNEILRRVYERGELLSRVRRFTLSGNEYKVPTVNESSRADGSRWGGVRGYWMEEGGTPTATKPDFGQVTLRLKKIGVLGYVTDEQLEDAPATGDLLMEAFTDELLFTAENAIVNGTGAGQPLGILNAACTVSITKETNQTAATIWGPNVTKMWARGYARGRRTSVWLHEQSVEPFLWGLTLEGRWGSETTSVDGIPVYMPAGTVMNQGQYPTLMGRPVIPTEYCKAVGTAGDLILADLTQYLWAEKREGPQQATSMHVRFIYGESTFRVFWRVDGRPWWQAALTPYSAGDTLSPFVTVAARG